jgi:hypothetical protein
MVSRSGSTTRRCRSRISPCITIQQPACEFAEAAPLAKLGFETRQMKPAEFESLIADETEKWEKVVKFSGIKMD